MFHRGFELKIKEAKQRLAIRSVFRNDLWRFVVFVVVTFLVCLSFCVNYGLISMNQIVYSRVNSSLGKQLIDRAVPLSLLSENAVLREIDSIWQRMGGDKNIAMGILDVERDGWYGDFQKSPVNMLIFLPRLISEPVVFTKNGSSLLLQLQGLSELVTPPVVEGNKLVYDEAYPGVLVVRMFKEAGLKEYYVIKDKTAQHSWAVGLNFEGGEINPLPSNQIEFYDGTGEKKFELGRLVGLDSAGKSIDKMIQQRLVDGNILEIKVQSTDGLVYPLLIDPMVQ